MQTSVGYSGVLFSYAVQESFLSVGATRSLMGFVNVPTKWYPWVMLVAMQVLMPNVSFIGHLAGLVCGMAHTRSVGRGVASLCVPVRLFSPLRCHRGLLNWIVPSRAMVEAIEASPILASVKAMPSFVPCTDISFDWAARRAAAVQPGPTTIV